MLTFSYNLRTRDLKTGLTANPSIGLITSISYDLKHHSHFSSDPSLDPLDHNARALLEISEAEGTEILVPGHGVSIIREGESHLGGFCFATVIIPLGCQVKVLARPIVQSNGIFSSDITTFIYNRLIPSQPLQVFSGGRELVAKFVTI